MRLPGLVKNADKFRCHFASLAQVLNGPRQGYRWQKASFRMLVGIYRHNIPTHTPQSGLHGVMRSPNRQNSKNGRK